MHSNAKLYLIPALLGDISPELILPPVYGEMLGRLKDFIVEDVRTARRFLKKVNSGIDISSITFALLNEHTAQGEIPALLQPLLEGRDTGLISEAGMPCVADPGAQVVALAHEKGIQVVPLSGPSSIFMALAASGFNGQQFSFHGYLPVDKVARAKKIRSIEQIARQYSETQIFIETPYRNMALFDALLRECRPDTRLCIASNITLPDEMIKSASIAFWKKNIPDIAKKPAVFLLF